MGKACKYYHMNYVWWMQGGRRGGGVYVQINILDFNIEHSNDSQDIKSSQWFSAHEFVVGHRPHYVHLTSTRRNSRDRCSQAFPIFQLPCVIQNANQRTKKSKKAGEAWE